MASPPPRNRRHESNAHEQMDPPICVVWRTPCFCFQKGGDPRYIHQTLKYETGSPLLQDCSGVPSRGQRQQHAMSRRGCRSEVFRLQEMLTLALVNGPVYVELISSHHSTGPEIPNNLCHLHAIATHHGCSSVSPIRNVAK